MRLYRLNYGEKHAIFCRGHDKGCNAGGAARDLDSENSGDIYCKKWIEENYGKQIASLIANTDKSLALL